MRHKKFTVFMHFTAILLTTASLVLTPVLLVSAHHVNGQKFDRDLGLQSVLQFFTLRGLRGGHAPENAAELQPDPTPEQAVNFEVLGHTDLGARDTYGDVWVHGDMAYVGTWSDPCRGKGVKIIDVSRLESPQVIASMGQRWGTSAEDVVVRSVSTAHFPVIWPRSVFNDAAEIRCLIDSSSASSFGMCLTQTGPRNWRSLG